MSNPGYPARRLPAAWLRRPATHRRAISPTPRPATGLSAARLCGYPPPGYPPPGYGTRLTRRKPPAIKPGVIPLRPLTLTDIFNGAVAYIRTNPKATLGLTRSWWSSPRSSRCFSRSGRWPRWANSACCEAKKRRRRAAGLVCLRHRQRDHHLLSAIVLSGMLTVIVGRAVFGAGITIGEAWQRVRGRLLPLIGYTLLWLLAVIVLVASWCSSSSSSFEFSGAAAFVVGIPLGLGLIALLIYLWTVLSFAPPLIVLERLGVFASISRSFELVKGDFWRVLGIRLLATLVAGVVAGAVSIPFSLTGQNHADGFRIHHDDSDRARAGRRSAARSARSSPRRSAPAWWCCSTPTDGSAPRRSTWCCRPARRSQRRVRRRTRPTTCGSPGSR